MVGKAAFSSGGEQTIKLHKNNKKEEATYLSQLRQNALTM